LLSRGLGFVTPKVKVVALELEVVARKVPADLTTELVMIDEGAFGFVEPAATER
jgi:hypothetical protein